MYYCNNCKKGFKNKKELYYGLCEDCYKEYLLKKLETLEFYEASNEKFSFSKFLKNFLKNIKKYFKQ